MRVIQANSALLRGDAISNVMRTNHRIMKRAGLATEIVLDFFSEIDDRGVELAELDFPTESVLTKIAYFLKVNKIHITKEYVKALLSYRRGKAKDLLASADIRIWHYGGYYPLFMQARPNDLVYFHNFGYPYLTEYSKVEISTSQLLHALKPLPLRFITPSYFNKEVLLRMGFKEDGITVLPLFQSHRHQLMHHKHATPHLLAYGRYARNKAIPELVQACVESKLPLTHFGDNATVKEYKLQYQEARRAADLNIKLFSKVPQIEPFFAEANIYICNSYHEGFNMPLIEAEAHGLPILARRGSAMDELIEDGQNGYLFDHVSEIEHLTERILADYQRMSKNAYYHAQAFTYAVYKKRYLRILHDALNTPH